MATSYTIMKCNTCGVEFPINGGHTCKSLMSEAEVRRILAEYLQTDTAYSHFAARAEISMRNAMDKTGIRDAVREIARDEIERMAKTPPAALKCQFGVDVQWAAPHTAQPALSHQPAEAAVRDADPPTDTKCSYCLYDYGHALWCKNWSGSGLDDVRRSEIQTLHNEVASLRRERDELAVRLARSEEDVRHSENAVVEELQKRDAALASIGGENG